MVILDEHARLELARNAGKQQRKKAPLKVKKGRGNGTTEPTTEPLVLSSLTDGFARNAARRIAEQEAYEKEFKQDRRRGINRDEVVIFVGEHLQRSIDNERAEKHSERQKRREKRKTIIAAREGELIIFVGESLQRLIDTEDAERFQAESTTGLVPERSLHEAVILFDEGEDKDPEELIQSEGEAVPEDLGMGFAVGRSFRIIPEEEREVRDLTEIEVQAEDGEGNRPALVEDFNNDSARLENSNRIPTKDLFDGVGEAGGSGGLLDAVGFGGSSTLSETPLAQPELDPLELRDPHRQVRVGLGKFVCNPDYIVVGDRLKTNPNREVPAGLIGTINGLAGPDAHAVALPENADDAFLAIHESIKRWHKGPNKEQ